MNLETKLNYMTQHVWTKSDAVQCWTRYHNLYFQKHKGALFRAQVTGTTHEYIQKECETFRRYAKMWRYYRCKQ